MINVYTHPDCERSCVLTMERLAMRNLQFQEIKLQNEPTIHKWLKEHQHFKSPVVEVLGPEIEMWEGYRPDCIDAVASYQAHREWEGEVPWGMGK